jgi:hypothetical protein
MTLLLAACLVGVVGAPAAVAQAPSTDPEAGTPAGTIYEIPLDDGRADAAPGSKPGAADPDGGDRSPLRSENNLGSSSIVPGAATGERSDDTPGKGPSGGRPVTGGDDAPTERDAKSAPALRPAAAAAPSLSRAVLLIVLSVVLAAGLGLAAHRAARRR